jgi:predicted negative regulator of RcsB-dependent stress response
MEDDVKHTADLYRLVAWAHARRKQLIRIGIAVVVVAAVVGFLIWHKSYNETAASEAIAKLKPPFGTEGTTASSADPYIKVANDYPGTAAGSRALLTAGGILFEAGKFKEAQDTFDRFVGEYPDSTLVNQAVLGVAASLEAQGKLAEATSRYDDFVHRHGMDATGTQAKSALARLYVAQNKPDKALQLYIELAQAGQAGNRDTWTEEAGIQAGELLQKYPELRKPKVPEPAPISMTGLTNLNLPPKK